MVRMRNCSAASLFLCLTVLIYGAFGSPTPDNPGMVEATLAVLLILSVLAAGLTKGMSLTIGRNFYLKSIQVLFICGMVLPLASGVYFGNDKGLILRDLAAFAFLGLPLFLSEKIASSKNAKTALKYSVLVAGVLFAVRSLIPAFNIWISPNELLYLSNSPLCLFAAIFLVCALFRELEDIKRANVICCLACFLGVAVILAAMLLDVQRATVGAVIISLAVFTFPTLIHAPKRVLLPLTVLAGVCMIFYTPIADAVAAMLGKTESVGWNMRIQEAMAVFHYLAAEPVRLFTGAGWGASFASPAVGGLDVNFTHSFLTTMALKGGVVMLLLSMFVTIAALLQIAFIYQRDKSMGLSLLWPLVIPVFLYASHKSLDFGLILLIIGVWSISSGPLHPAVASDKKHETLI